MPQLERIDGSTEKVTTLPQPTPDIPKMPTTTTPAPAHRPEPAKPLTSPKEQP